MSGLFDKPIRMEAMSGLDAAFLYLETPNAPMHIGGLSVIEGSLAYETFRDHLKSRIHTIKSLRQRLVTVPLSLDRPYWVDDPDFNIDRHLHHTALPRPGGWQQLRRLTSRIFGQPLDRNRPLWELVFVEGLDNIPQVPPGSVAVISKVHHAAIDGVSGADILALLYDISPQPRVVPPPPPQPEPGEIPTDLEMLAHSALNFATRPLKLPRILLETAKATARAGVLSRASRTNLPTLPFSAPPTVFNEPISADRIWNTALLSLDRIKRLKQVLGFTVNDVVLAICAGALRRYLLEKDQLPEKPLVAMVPVSTRTKEEKNALGNQVSAMFLQLATDIADPIERLQKIHENAQQGKSYQGAVDARSLVEYSEFVPFGLAGQAARLYSRSQLSRHHRPVFNCVITNVPGPQVPLYLAGHRLLAHMGMAPILDGLGLILPIFSYNGVVSISPYSSPQVMPDLDKFARYLRESANELEAAVLALDVARESEAEVADVAAVFSGLADHLESHPDMTIPATGIYQFIVTGKQAQQWVFDWLNRPRRIYEGVSAAATCTLTMAEADFAALAAGTLDGTAAFMQGKLKVDGDTNEAIAFGRGLAALATGTAPTGPKRARRKTAAEAASRCEGTTKSGGRCRNRAKQGSSYCHLHAA